MPASSLNPKDEPEPEGLKRLLEIYHALEDHAPSIAYVNHWQAWVCKGDRPIEEFETLQIYLDEYPYLVEVDSENAFIMVTDPGSGSGSMEWRFKCLYSDSEEPIALLTETDFQPGQVDSKIFLARFSEGSWIPDSELLPYIHQYEFFKDFSARSVLEKHELIGLEFCAVRDGAWQIEVHPRPNFNFECADGKLHCAEEVPEEDHGPICEAWLSFSEQPLCFSWSSQSQIFEAIPLV